MAKSLWLMVRMPRLHSPIDADDRRLIGRLMVYSLFLLWASLGLALAIGGAVRIFLWAAFG